MSYRISRYPIEGNLRCRYCSFSLVNRMVQVSNQMVQINLPVLADHFVHVSPESTCGPGASLGASPMTRLIESRYIFCMSGEPK